MKGMNKVAARSGSGDAKRPSASPRRSNGQDVLSADDAKDRQFVTALARGLQILGCFSSSHPELSGTEIAAMLRIAAADGVAPVPDDDEAGIPRCRRRRPVAAGVARTASGLHAVIEYDRSANWRAPISRSLRRKWTAQPGSPSGTVRTCVSSSAARATLQLLMSLRVGSRVPIATSAMGWAYLAGLPHDEREAVIEDVKPSQQIWKKAEAPLRSALKSFERDGFILNEGVLHPGYVTVAAPVIGRDGLPAFDRELRRRHFRREAGNAEDDHRPSPARFGGTSGIGRRIRRPRIAGCAVRPLSAGTRRKRNAPSIASRSPKSRSELPQGDRQFVMALARGSGNPELFQPRENGYRRNRARRHDRPAAADGLAALPHDDADRLSHPLERRSDAARNSAAAAGTGGAGLDSACHKSLRSHECAGRQIWRRGRSCRAGRAPEWFSCSSA